MNKSLMLLSGFGLGAGTMYFMDPQLGRRRRALIRDQVLRVTNQIEDEFDTALRDLSHRVQGLVARSAAHYSSDQPDERVLVERVRSKLGRYVSHPAAIEVEVHDGSVTISGPVLEHEVRGLLSAVASVRGVGNVENHLDIHRQADISALQGGQERVGERLNVFESNWAPATRLLAGTAGAMLFAYGLTRRFPVACVLGTAGIALAARATTNPEFKNMQNRSSRAEEPGRRGGPPGRSPHLRHPAQSSTEDRISPPM
jgi:hypothetical protein